MFALLKGTLGTILFIIVFIALVLAILFHNTISNLKIFRSANEKAAERAARKAAAEEEYFRRTSKKNYRQEEEKPKFDKDYFKSKEEAKEQPKQQPKPEQPEKKRTTTTEGVTIIDQREESHTDRKIFDKDEGEYVEFEEI